MLQHGSLLRTKRNGLIAVRKKGIKNPFKKLCMHPEELQPTNFTEKFYRCLKVGVAVKDQQPIPETQVTA